MPVSPLTASATLRFVLRRSASAGAFQHLALFAADAGPAAAPLAHWVLPTQSARGLHQQPHALLTLAPADLVLPAAELDAGACALATPTAWPTPADRLRLCLHGTRLRGEFALLRLRPGGHTWLFGPVQYVPDQFRRGPQLAPPWPRSVSPLA